MTGPVSGNSVQLESMEAIFHQDLNGDGVIGVPSSANPPESTNLGEVEITSFLPVTVVYSAPR